MKVMSEEVSLHGKSEEITISELRNRPGDVFQQVSLGKQFIVTKNGEQIALICPPKWNTSAVVNRDGKFKFV